MQGREPLVLPRDMFFLPSGQAGAWGVRREALSLGGSRGQWPGFGPPVGPTGWPSVTVGRYPSPGSMA